VVERPDDERENRSLARAHPEPRQQHGRRRDDRLHQGARDRRRRLPREAQGRARCASPSASAIPSWSTRPDGVTFEVPQATRIVVKGIDKEKVGQVAADIRSCASPSRTRARACATAGERILRKAGKAGKK
jgi:hypothetical protein